LQLVAGGGAPREQARKVEPERPQQDRVHQYALMADPRQQQSDAQSEQQDGRQRRKDRTRHRDSIVAREPAADQRKRGLVDGLGRSEEHTSELQSRRDLVCRLLLEKKKQKI